MVSLVINLGGIGAYMEERDVLVIFIYLRLIKKWARPKTKEGVCVSGSGFTNQAHFNFFLI